MNNAKNLGLCLLMMLVPVLQVQADCPETPSGAHTFLGVDVRLPANIANRPEIREVELLRVQLVWVPRDEETRYRDQHVIDIDWVQQTSTNVDVWDGELQAIRERNVAPVALLWSNPRDGQIHLEACMGVISGSGPVLMFAHYGLDGVIYPRYTVVAPVVNGFAVTNEEVSSFISDTFNNGLDRHIISDVEKATGVEPGHYLAQSFLFQTLSPSVHLFDMNPAVFFDAQNAIVKQNRVYVTGNGSWARVPLAIGAVYSDDLNIMGEYRTVRDLEHHLGKVQVLGRFGVPFGYNLVLDARPDLEIETTPCAEGRSQITVDFAYPSELPGEISLFIGDSPAPVKTAPSLDESISCDYDYRVEGRRKFENEVVTSGEIWVPVATQGTLVKVQYQANYHGAPPRMTSPSIETVLKVWDVTDIESLYGTHEFFCDKAAGTEVDSIDEIAYRRTHLLSAEEQASFDPFTDAGLNDRAWGDGDGDGTICDGDELSNDGDWGIITTITLSVYPSG